MPVSATRLSVVVAVVLLATFGSAQAQDSRQDPKSLPPVTIDAPPPSPLLPNPGAKGAPSTIAIPGSGGGRQTGTGGGKGCADGTAGNDTSLGCINERLKRKVDEVNPTFNTPPLDAKSSDVRVGNVNIPAVKQQYGPNFGHSAVPYRPTEIYSIGGRH
jgi:hypothetical protein